MQRNRTSRQWWWYVVYLLCVCVFLLRLNAKMSAYDAPAHANSSASSKLWANGAKMEIRSAVAFSPLLWLAALILFALHLLFATASRRLEVGYASYPSITPQFTPFRFLRPPPAFSL
jgi:uncharacterized membrane protein YhaH (DUF805 family)